MKSYTCFAPNLFKIWTRFYIIGLFAGIAFFAMTQNAKLSIVMAISLSLFVALVQIVGTYIKITNSNDEIHIVRLYDSNKYRCIKNVDKFWTYGFGAQEIVADGGGGTSGKVRSNINQINIVAKIDSEFLSVILVEEIYISEKFPNGVPYNETINLKNYERFKVWNLDSCLNKLKLNV